MPSYIVTAPDGSKHKVNAPEGATQEQVLAYAQQQFAAKPETPATPAVAASSPAQQEGQAAFGKPSMLVDNPVIAPVAAFASGVSDAILPKWAQPQEGAEYRQGLTERVQAQNPNAAIAGMVAGTGAQMAAMGAGGAGTRLLPNAVMGAELGAYQSRGDPAATALGAAAGAGGAATGKLLTGAFTPSKDAAALMRRGVTPTLGQAVDDSTLVGRAVKGIEAKATSIPIFGDIINANRNKAVEQFRSEAYRRASPPGVEVKAQGHQAVETLASAFDDAYGKLYKGGREFRVVPKDIQDIAKAVRDPDLMVADDARKQAAKWLTANLPNKGGKIPGETLKKLESEAGKRVSEAVRKGELGAADMYSAIKDSLVAMRNRGLTGEERATAAKIDKAYANFKRVQRASAQANDGLFSPAQLNQAVRALSGGKDKSQMARGKALMQDLSAPGAAALQQFPNSGTADRAINTAILGGAGYLQPQVLAGPAMVAGASYPPVSRFLLGAYPAQQGLQSVTNAFAPTAISSNQLLNMMNGNR